MEFFSNDEQEDENDDDEEFEFEFKNNLPKNEQQKEKTKEKEKEKIYEDDFFSDEDLNELLKDDVDHIVSKSNPTTMKHSTIDMTLHEKKNVKETNDGKSNGNNRPEKKEVKKENDNDDDDDEEPIEFSDDGFDISDDSDHGNNTF